MKVKLTFAESILPIATLCSRKDNPTIELTVDNVEYKYINGYPTFTIESSNLEQDGFKFLHSLYYWGKPISEKVNPNKETLYINSEFFSRYFKSITITE